MKTDEIALHCISGIVQYAESEAAMLLAYNSKGAFYEIRTDESGNRIMWHKGQARKTGIFKPSGRVAAKQ